MFIGIVTYNREEQFNRIFGFVEHLTNNLICIKDGPLHDYAYNPDLLQLSDNLGVGRCKNIIIDKFLESDEDHLFILEDDVLVKDKELFDFCIRFSEESGLKHFNWNSYRNKSFSYILQYPNFQAKSYTNTEASFSYFHRDFVKEVRFDDEFINAWEHIDMEFVGYQKGFLPPFWCFVSPEKLDEYLECIDEGKSTISGIGENKERYDSGAEYFVKKHGRQVSQIPRSSVESVADSLRTIKEKYSK